MARRRRSRLELRRHAEEAEAEELVESDDGDEEADEEADEPQPPPPLPESLASNPALAGWLGRILKAPNRDLPELYRERADARFASDDELKAAVRSFPTNYWSEQFRAGLVLWDLFQDRSLLDEVVLRHATEDTEDELREMLDSFPAGAGSLGPLLVRIADECPDFLREHVEDRLHLIAQLLGAGEAGERVVVEVLLRDEDRPLFVETLRRIAHRYGPFEEGRPVMLHLRKLRYHTRGWVLAGCVLWKLTGRIDRRWLKRLARGESDLAGWSEVGLILDTLGQLLPLTPLAGDALVQLARPASECLADLAIAPVASLGAHGLRGWSTLARMGAVCDSGTRRSILEYAASTPRTAQALLPLARHSLDTLRKAVGTDPPYLEPGASDELEAACRAVRAAGPAGKALAPELVAILKTCPLHDDAPDGVIAACLDALEGIGANDPSTLAGLRARLVEYTAEYGTSSAAFRLVGLAWLRLDPRAVLRELVRPQPDGRLLELIAATYPRLDQSPEDRAANARLYAQLLLHPNFDIAGWAAALLAHHADAAHRLTPWLVAACCRHELLVERVSKILQSYDTRHRLVVSLIARMGGTDQAVALAAAAALWGLSEYRPVFEMLRREHTRPGGGLLTAFLDWHLKQKRSLAAVCNTLGTSLRDWIDQDPERQRFLARLGGLWLELQLDALLKAIRSPDGDRVAALARAYELLPGADDLLACLARLVLGALVEPDLMRTFGTLHPVKYFVKRHGVDIPAGKERRDAAYEVLAEPAGPERSRAFTATVFHDVAAVHPDVQALLTHEISWFRWAGLTLLEGYPLPAE